MMLRFADIMVGNPENPEVQPISLKAMVTEEPGLRLAENIIQTLRLTKVIMPRTANYGGVQVEETVQMDGIACLQCCGVGLETGVLACQSGAWLGKELAEQLGLEVKPYQEKQGEVAHILCRENAISEADRLYICSHILSQRLQPLGEKYRKTLCASPEKIKEPLNALLYRAVVNHIEPFYNLKIESWEEPQLIVYEKGGVYAPHADGSYWKRDGEGDGGQWARFMDRDISVLIYLNDDFTGGELHFPDLDYRVVPHSGLLVAFPSNHSYRHGAEETTSGQRMAIVTWMRAEGTPREHNKPVPRYMKADYAPARK